MLGLLLAFPFMMNGQEISYVKTTTMTGASSGIVSTEYVDGLGRTSLTVSKDASPGCGDLATLQEYDLNGRPSRTWLPAPINAGGGFCGADAFKQSSISNHGDSKPFSQTRYDGSPLNRRVEELGPGSIWHTSNKCVRTEYTTNSSNNPCRKYEVSTDGTSFSLNGTWQTGDLDVTVSVDEDGNRRLTFTDMRGLTVLQRDINSTDNNRQHDTYFIYDVYGNLCFVLPPMASDILTSQNTSWTENSDDVARYCYCYKYDNRNLCVSKKLPGCDPVLMRYDKAHRLVFIQDGNLRAAGKYKFTFSDMFGREVVSGLCSDSLPDISGIEVSANAAYYIGGINNGVNYVLGYSLSPSLRDIEPLFANYFDFYNYLNIFATEKDSLQYNSMTGYDDRYWNNGSNSARGLLTGTAAMVLGDTTVLVKSLYYDSHGNVIQSHESNAVGGYEHDYMHLTFTGKPLTVRHEHSTDSTHHVDVNTMTYDAMERPLTTTVTHDGTLVDVITNTYDDLGRFASQTCLNNQQTTNYSYNIRNWVSLIDAGLDAQSYPVMKQWLHYADAVDGSTPCYNGNISAMDWNTNTSPDFRFNRYCYSYDGMNRLTGASYMMYYPLAGMGFNNQENYSTNYTYDLNSNITALQRYGRSEQYSIGNNKFYDCGVIDELTITRDGNQLKKVTDQCDELTYAGAMDFKDGGNEQVEYTWDANGNMTSDLDKGLTEIKYNILNLPEKITHSDGHITYITYAADGRKLNVTYKINPLMVIVGPLDPIEFPGEPIGPLGLNGMSGNEYGLNGGGIGEAVLPGIDPMPTDVERVIMTRDYCGNYTYRNGSIERIMMGNGFWQDSVYYVQIKDYQGNVRAVLDQNRYLVERNEYYPYGGLINASDSQLQPYKYSAKELDRENGLNWYDSQARWYDPMLPLTTTQDPMAEKYYSISPYTWCAGNPVNRIDPNGKASFWHNGKLIGSDGINDNRILVIKTTEKSFGDIDNGSYVQGAGLSKKEQKSTIKFIENNSGNVDAFRNSSIAYDNSIEIEGSEINRQAMVNIVMKDDGKGGTSDANNREYGGYIKNGAVIEENPGPVSNLHIDDRAQISLEEGFSTFHSHPSGTLSIYTERKDNNTIKMRDNSKITKSFVQSPSRQDVNAAGNQTHYVFGRSDNKVYIYNRNGVQAVIPMKQFVTPK